MTIYKQNKYTKWYYKIIQKAIARSILRVYIEGEIHHIIPKSLGGLNDKHNLVKLTYREHYICHLLLTKMCSDKNHEIKMCWALHRLTFSKTFYNSHNYEIVRKIHIKNLIENHHSKRIDGWNDKMRDQVLKTWEKSEDRKKIVSEKMKKRWKNDYNSLKKQAIKNLPEPMIGKNNPAVIEIEYKGKIYYGWRELYESTKVSKHLYNKYYLNNIDPEYRIGTNGPPPK